MEGAKYDADDPSMPISRLVPSAAEKRAAELAKISPQERREKLRVRAEAHWRATFPKDPPQSLENDSYLLLGNVPAERLETTARWADEAVKSLQAFFDVSGTAPFPAGLAIIVLKDRRSYEEFNRAVAKRAPQAAIHGHAVVSLSSQEAYVVVEELAERASNSTPSARDNLVEQLTAAFVIRSDSKMPDWLVLGMSRLYAAGFPESVSTAKSGKSGKKSAKPGSVLSSEVYRLVGSLEKPGDILVDGSFSASAAREVGSAMVTVLVETRGRPLFIRLVKALQGGTEQSDAFKHVYGTDIRDFAESFRSLAAQSARSSTK
jgi:hypothetical protein